MQTDTATNTAGPPAGCGFLAYLDWLESQHGIDARLYALRAAEAQRLGATSVAGLAAKGIRATSGMSEHRCPGCGMVAIAAHEPTGWAGGRCARCQESEAAA